MPAWCLTLLANAELAELDTSGWRPLRPAQLRKLEPTP